jgi:periodic tryptophan protein 1
MSAAGLRGLVYYSRADEDPYLELPGQVDAEEDEDLKVLASENLVVAGRTEEEMSYLDIYRELWPGAD